MSTPTARDLIAEAVGRGSEAISDDAAIGVTAGWDSLAHMRLVALLEDALARPLTSGEVVGVRSLRDVSAVLDTRAP
jgi:acyl carrier protein